LGVPTSLSPFAALCRHPHVRRLTFASVKTKALTKALLDTAVPPVEQHQLFALQLDSFKAQALEQHNSVDKRLTRTIFGQTFQQLHLHKHKRENKYGDLDRDSHRFHIGPAQRAFKCIFAGLYADDFGRCCTLSLSRTH
jgi:hypothetical protein